jgi:hypothetical protein
MTSVNTEIASVTRLMMRCHFKTHLPRSLNGIRAERGGLSDGGTA